MDILNWLRIKKQNLIRTTLDSPKDLVVLGADVSYQKRGDKYQSYAMPAEDFLATAARPYKVYTALLTQSGGDGPASIEDGFLTIGTTYQITDQGGSGWDFTNVGAPNNNVGTYFVATGTTPTNWGVGVSLSYNTGAPVVTVLENTIGNVYFTYDSVGIYYANLLNAFVEYKTLITITQLPIFLGADEGGLSTLINSYRFDSDKVRIYCSNNSGTIDDSLVSTPIEIRVYN